MEELCRKYHCVMVNRVKNSNLTFDFSISNLNGIFRIGIIIMPILAIITKNYRFLLFDVFAVIYFIIAKIQNHVINFKTGFIRFEGNSIIRTVSYGDQIIDCTKGIFINISRKEHLHVTYQLTVSYKDEKEMKHEIVLASTTSDNSVEEFEKFITNFYYEKELKENIENTTQNTIRFCM